MSVLHERILKACIPILEESGYHDTSERHERLFLNAYQVFELLQKNGDPLCQELIDDCKGDFRGKDAGSYDGPARRIAHALGNHRSQIETQYVNTAFMEINGRQPSGEDCGIFRLRQ